jgi:glycosyltransferase involved in cell wall biosynthesis
MMAMVMSVLDTRIGVVVPVHGWAPYLAEALDGVLANDPDEVVVVDDASPEPVVLLPEHTARCRLVRRDVNGGLAAARDTGIAALGDVGWVALCDDDDAWAPGKLAAQRAALAGDPGVAALFCPALVVGPDGRATGERWPAPPRPLLPGLYERNPLCASSAVVRRDVAWFDAALRRAEDWDLWLRLAGRGERLGWAPDGLVHYRRRPGTLSADVAALARAGQEVHARHAGLVDASVRARVAAADARALADGLVRRRDYAAARAVEPRRVRRALLAAPGPRALMGRRDPYRAG